MIGDYSFYNCKNLTSVVIPSTVEFIGYEAFTYCSSVTDVYCYPNASDLFWAEGHCDDFAPNKATVCHVNAGQLEAYRKKYGNDVNVSFTDNPGAVSVPDGDDFAMAIPVDMTYDGEPKIIDVVEKSEGLGRSTVKYYADKEREKEIECPADAGTYYIAVDVEDGDAFTAAEKVFGEFRSYTILKAAAPDLSELTDDQKAHAVEGLVYNGDYQDLITPPESLPEGYTKVLYSLDGQHLGEWDFYGRKAGTYTVNVKYIGDNNHRDFYGEDITVTIAEEAYSAPGITYEKGEGSVQLNWTAVEGAEKYGIVGFVDGEWKLLARSNDTTYRLGKLKAGEYVMDFSNAIVVTLDPVDTSAYPEVSVEYNKKYHQFRLNWTAVDGAQNYGVAIYQAGKWKILKQDIPAAETSFTSPKLKAGQTYKMIVCAKVDGKWDLTSINTGAVPVTIK